MPSLHIRIDKPTEDKIKRYARDEGISVSELVRAALEPYLSDDHAHIRRVSVSRRRASKNSQDVALPKHSPSLRLDRL
jgi:hypothetical protein